MAGPYAPPNWLTEFSSDCAVRQSASAIVYIATDPLLFYLNVSSHAFSTKIVLPQFLSFLPIFCGDRASAPYRYR